MGGGSGSKSRWQHKPPGKVPASIAIVDAAVVCSGWHGVNALLKDRDCCPIIPSLGWVSRSVGDSLVVMED